MFFVCIFLICFVGVLVFESFYMFEQLFWLLIMLWSWEGGVVYSFRLFFLKKGWSWFGVSWDGVCVNWLKKMLLGLGSALVVFFIFKLGLFFLVLLCVCVIWRCKISNIWDLDLFTFLVMNMCSVCTGISVCVVYRCSWWAHFDLRDILHLGLRSVLHCILYQTYLGSAFEYVSNCQSSYRVICIWNESSSARRGGGCSIGREYFGKLRSASYFCLQCCSISLT